jgi:hypothetical protein
MILRTRICNRDYLLVEIYSSIYVLLRRPLYK